MLILQDRRRWKRFQQDILPGRHNEDKAFLERLKKRGYECSFDVDRLSQPFDKPSLVLAGRQDASVGYKDTMRLADIYTGSTFASWTGQGTGSRSSRRGCSIVSPANGWTGSKKT